MVGLVEEANRAFPRDVLHRLKSELANRPIEIGLVKRKGEEELYVAPRQLSFGAPLPKV